jgi:hypothetical protein
MKPISVPPCLESPEVEGALELRLFVRNVGVWTITDALLMSTYRPKVGTMEECGHDLLFEFDLSGCGSNDELEV